MFILYLNIQKYWTYICLNFCDLNGIWTIINAIVWIYHNNFLQKSLVVGIIIPFFYINVRTLPKYFYNMIEFWINYQERDYSLCKMWKLYLKRNTYHLRKFLFMQNTLLHTHNTAFCIAASVSFKFCLAKSWLTDLTVWLGEKAIEVSQRRVVW